jgi:hypothetical protein
MRLHAVIILINSIIHLSFLVYILTWTHKDSQFSTHGVSGVKNLKCVCSRLEWCDVSGFMVHFMVLICGLVQVLFLSHTVNF